MKLVTCVIVLLGLSPFGSVGSAASTDVEDLDSGACWVQQTRGSFWKISSFNDGQAFYLDPTRLSGEFEPALTTTLKAQGLSRFAGGPYEVHLHCSGSGHLFKINFYRTKPPICVYARNGFQGMQIYAWHDGHSGECQGQGLQSLTLLLQDPKMVKRGVDILRSRRLAAVVADIEVLEKFAIIFVTLKKPYRFYEDRARSILLKDRQLAPLLSTIEYAWIQTISGSSMPLLHGNHPGF